MDMEIDVFAQHSFGKAALQKLAPTPDNFRLYQAEWLGDKPNERHVMRVIGAEFRAAKTGPNKGKLSVMVEGSKRTAYVTKVEMQAFGA